MDYTWPKNIQNSNFFEKKRPDSLYKRNILINSEDSESWEVSKDWNVLNVWKVLKNWKVSKSCDNFFQKVKIVYVNKKND